MILCEGSGDLPDRVHGSGVANASKYSGRGYCFVCCRWVQVRTDGFMRRHGKRSA